MRVVTVERGVDPRDLALVAFGGAGPLHACAIADALGMRAVIVPPRAGVCSAVRAACARRRRARSCAASRAAISPTRSRAVARRAARSSARARRSRPRSTAATSDRATSSRCRPPTTSPPSTSGATVTRGPGAPVEVVAVRARASLAGAAAHRGPARVDTGRASTGPGGRRRTRLHGVDPRRAGAAEPRGARRVGAWSGHDDGRRRRCRCWISRLDRRRRRDGRGAAARRVQPEHQGARRLLVRAVHAPTARCSCRPSTFRCTSGRCRRRCAPRSTRAATRSGPASRSSSTTRSRAGRTSTTSRSSRPCSARRRAARLGREPRPSRRPRRHGARLDAARRDGDLPRRAAHSAGALDARGRGDRSSRRRARPTNGAAISTRNAARTGSGVDAAACARADCRRARRDRRVRRAPDARRAAVAARRHLRVRGRARLDRWAAEKPVAGAHRGARHRRRRRGHVRLHRAPTRNAPGSVNAVEAVTVERGRVRACDRSSIPTCRRTAVRSDRCTCVAPAGSIVAAQPPVAVGAGQRRGQPARRRRVSRRARAGGARPRRRRVARHDEQRARRRSTASCTTRRSAAGRAAARARARHERCAHRDDQHARHAGRGVRARVSDAGAPLRVADGQRGRRRRAGWRRHRARARDARPT